MKKMILTSMVFLAASFEAQATSTLERNIVECTISTSDIFEELILKSVEVQDADNYVYESYVLDHTWGEMEGVSSDIFGRHEQVRSRIFTTANAEADGVIADGARDYVLISQYEHSELIIKLIYEGLDQDDFPTYSMYFEGGGPAYDIVVSSVQDILAESEHYNRFDAPLCTSHFNLDEFVTQ